MIASAPFWIQEMWSGHNISIGLNTHVNFVAFLRMERYIRLEMIFTLRL
jgi:hypothetical protein